MFSLFEKSVQKIREENPQKYAHIEQNKIFFFIYFLSYTRPSFASLPTESLLELCASLPIEINWNGSVEIEST